MKFSATTVTGEVGVIYTPEGGRPERMTIERAREIRADLDQAIKAAVAKTQDRAAKLAREEARA